MFRQFYGIKGVEFISFDREVSGYGFSRYKKSARQEKGYFLHS